MEKPVRQVPQQQQSAPARGTTNQVQPKAAVNPAATATKPAAEKPATKAVESGATSAVASATAATAAGSAATPKAIPQKPQPTQVPTPAPATQSQPTATNATVDAERLESVNEALEEITNVMAQVHEAESFAQGMKKAEAAILRIVDATRLTIYQKGKNDREIVSKYISGQDRKPQEVRVPLNPTSIAGYVALSQRPVLISDVSKSELLQKIHPQLKFNQSFDKRSGFRTESVIVIPIRYREVLLGVFQVINKTGGGSFTKQDFYRAELIARHIAQKFRHELQAAQAPFEYLLHRGIISAELLQEYEEQARKQNAHVRDIIMKNGKASKKEVGVSLEQYYQVPFVEFDEFVQIPKHLLKGLTPAYIAKQTWVPILEEQGEVFILIDDPSNAPLIMEIQRTIPAEKYVFRLGFLEDIQKYLSQIEGVKGLNSSTSSLLRELEAEVDLTSGEEPIAELTGNASEDEATVIRLVNQIIKEASENRASDIHIEQGKGKAPSMVRIRVDGSCRVLAEIPPTHKNAIISRIKIMSKLDISERRKPQDGKISMSIDNRPIELRVATIPTVHGENAVLRLLASGDPLPMHKLSLSPRNFETAKSLVDTPYGLFLVVGPTGSGKTTTLHAVLGYLNTEDRKIWTAEDPVEITQRGLCQVAVQPKIGFNFAAALRAFLRADPDIVMIGEMRDHETAHIAIEASLTGHLVLSTLHTNSAPETITRLLDLGLDPASFSDALLGVLAQRLVRTLCVKCKEPYPMEVREYDTLMRFYGEDYFEELNVAPGRTELYRAKGCPVCGGTGYRGRMGIHELLSTTPEMRRLIYRKAPIQEIRQLSLEQGTRSLMQDGISKLIEGHTDFAQVRKIAAG
jgi:type II secretory ATPase GspE/PulE/Tfp pilus assembly ATPase PilB-like protein